MLVTRQFDTEQSHWSSKFEAAFDKSTSTRMSSYDGPLSTQPDWQGHYSFLPPGENNIFAQPFQQALGSGSNNDVQSQQSPSSAQNSTLENPSQSRQSAVNSPTSHHLDPLGLRQSKAETPTREQSDIQGTNYAIKTEPANEETLSSTDAPGHSLGSNPTGSKSSAGQAQDAASTTSGNEDTILGKEEDDEVLDDDEMVEVEGEGSGVPMTAAERTAARRKMKRFRLTHQQTRFLMSEFAKQPHPDAAHRERLSREIPGLSPRQVQVWFQNRRAKIKRLTADDRDRMIKMRAVPDDFDNVQALHSPYGAVHALGTPITPPVDFGSSSYADHMMRPLMVDTMRRGDGDDHMSPTGLSPAFGNIGFTTPGTMSNSDILSPLSPASNDRGYYSGQLTSPLGGSRTSNPFARQNSLDTGVQMHLQSRQQVRPLQPLQLRETMSRSRSDNLQSPLRSSMSWKGDSIDYSAYPGSGSSPGMAGRHHSVYQPDQMGSNPGSALGYDSGSYSSSGVQTSSTNINYSSLPQPSQNRSRLRAASATLPLGLDLRHQFRSVSSLQPPVHSSTPRSSSTAPYGGSSAYTSSFPSAPLTAPIDFPHSRNPGGIRSAIHDYHMPQMSAPIAPSQEFSQALHGNMGGSSTRTPMRDTFGGGPLGIGQGQGSNERSDDYSQDGLGGSSAALKSKRSSFSLSQSGHTSGPAQSSQSYGHTT
ncbi:Uu.00g089080.m01.CDS01 [Anthostomella pinea]|uniref:Uu.00g089080.m01.CDS01 n=1 Tax=Anthostomella pinea TaxID=933095 RepID=A0AAI8VNA8_9PEZI|nr:Uu.00g089080.m01.CDS01 [Anthostomella pinea]